MQLAIEKLTEATGARVLGMDRDRLVEDPDVAAAVLEALENLGVLVFPAIGLDDGDQIAFGRHLGELVVRAGHPVPEVTVITQTPDNALSEYFRGNLLWHIDGAMDDVPCKAGVLTARVMEPGDGGTEFASTYAAYDMLSESEKAHLEGLRVIHSLEATLRPVYPDPTPEQLNDWRTRGPGREHPLVWKHRSGRRSLVLGSAAEAVVGMGREEGRQLLADLLARATRPDHVLRHEWTVGDMVVWDNTGILHRVTGHNPTSRRELHRVTVAGEEPIG